MGDLHLRPAIDLLARIVNRQSGRQVFVDYRDLEIRHLGSIYEGLLEYQLRLADTPLRVRTEKGREIYEPLDPAQAAGAGVLPGEVYLVTDKGERKTSGSYYTPDYIVKYMVEQTVRPILETVRQKYTNTDGSLADPAGLEQAILRLNILDPSMGSGHFLVEAADFIARYLVALDLPQPAEAEAESDLAYWRRRVAQSCIYGLDLNPLAVELAKLSLWLATVARGKPLSFLDHHLRHGNSLVGARVADLPLEGLVSPGSRRKSRQRQKAEVAQRAAGQISMLDDSAFAGSMRTAAGFMAQIEHLRGDTLAEVREAEQIYQQGVEQVTAKARCLADIWTARFFGLSLDEALWTPLARYLIHGGLPYAAFDQLLDRSDALKGQYQFFHWELEFPEVFFNPHGQLDPAAGFDAIIGNPPYVRQERLQSLKPYFEANYASFHGVADLYLYFYEQGIRLLNEGGKLAYISSGTFARANFAKSFRALLPTIAQIEKVIDFGENQPFEGAEMVRPSIVTLSKGQQEQEFRSLFISYKIPEDLALALAQDGVDCTPEALQQPEWIFQPAVGTRLLEKILKQGIPLNDVVNGKMYRGILTGLNDVFIIDQAIHDRLIGEDPACSTIIKPILRGQDLRPWYQEDEGLWLISFPYRWTREQFGEGLEKSKPGRS